MQPPPQAPEGVPSIYAPPAAEVAKPPVPPPAPATPAVDPAIEQIIDTLNGSSRWMLYTALFSFLMAFFYCFTALMTLDSESSTIVPTAPGSLDTFFFLGSALVTAVFASSLFGAARRAKVASSEDEPLADILGVTMKLKTFWWLSGLLSLIGIILISVSMIIGVAARSLS